MFPFAASGAVGLFPFKKLLSQQQQNSCIRNKYRFYQYELPYKKYRDRQKVRVLYRAKCDRVGPCTVRFLALFFIRGQRADGPDGPCDGRCVENKRQSKVDRTPQKRFQHTHESRGVVGARGGYHGAGAWVADMACWETHGDVRAPRPHAVVRTWHGWLGHGDGLTSATCES